MDTKNCNGCQKEIEDDEVVLEYPSESGYYYCADCVEELENSCPRCGGQGCNYCLMLEW